MNTSDTDQRNTGREGGHREEDVVDPTIDGESDERLSTGEYVRLTVLNRVSLLGIGVALAGAVAIVLTAPTGPFPASGPFVGGGALLVGLLVFAVGFTIGQRALGDRDDW